MKQPRAMISAKRKTKGRRSNKLIKTSILLGNEFIRAHIPSTSYMTRASLMRMVNKYGMVYVKPRNGSMGRGVIRIKKQGLRYSCHTGAKVKSYKSFDELYSAILKKTKGESYIVQKGIHSLRYHGKIYDFRVVVQRSPNGRFEVTGIAGRISKRGRVVSNGAGGGSVGSVDSLLTPYQRNVALPRMKTLSLAVMHEVRKHWPSLNEIGLDIALDYNLKPWIIEYNTNPDHLMFVVLRDRQAVARIIHYGARYGKRYRLFH
ncbi:MULTISPECIES: YheC/YheD family protein [Paenibacillus]|uniref:YheC/YheD family protein n=1 Tax=Paenibacillus TaxID=44249 RepID=UPI00203BFEE8|nr:YheC/YheD family protein [Paenibacillus camelliae]MCM3633747.1 YheC/YheD family protein [Paenibacillus camelliae]